jgi:hypothetical protein
MDVPGSASVASDQSHTGILLSRDLIFTTKVQGTARELGYNVLVIGNLAQAKSAIGTLQPRVIFVDLTAGELSAPAAMSDYVKLAGPLVWVVAFGPHVDIEALANARAAGCQVVLPRSKFAGDLPTLMQLYFSKRPSQSVRSNGLRDADAV